MVNNYIDPIAEALWLLDQKSFPKDHYYSFAWVGLNSYAYSQEDRASAEYYLNTNNYSNQIESSSRLCN